MSLEVVRWGEFKLRDIFDIRPTASGIDKIKLVQGEGTYPYVTRSDTNNGINSFVCEQPDYVMNVGECITVGLDTQTAFYQPAGFYTGQNIQVLRSPKLNAANAKFMLPLLRKTLSIFSWGGNGATLTRLKRSRIFLPIDEAGRPDYEFMEKFIHVQEQSLIREYVAYISARIENVPVVSLDGVKWGTFKIGDLFRIEQGKCSRATELKREKAEIPYLGATNKNNGVLDFVEAEAKLKQKGNCVAFIKDGEGSMGYAVYKAEDFIATTNMALGYAEFLDRYTGMFITTVSDKVRGKYSYNYKRNEERLKNEMIQLPVNDTDSPDWDFMHSFMKHIETQKLSAVISHFSRKITPRTTSRLS